MRAASGELNTVRHTCGVQYTCGSWTATVWLPEIDETHLMRYFFPQELNLFLDCAALKLVRLGVFPDVDRQPDETSWNVLAVARAV